MLLTDELSHRTSKNAFSPTRITHTHRCRALSPAEPMSPPPLYGPTTRAGSVDEAEGSRMAAASKYATAEVGLHGPPRWYETLEKQVGSGTLSRVNLADAQLPASQASI